MLTNLSRFCLKALCGSAASLALTASNQAANFSDDFSSGSIDPANWSVEIAGTGPEASVVNERLELRLPGPSSGAEPAVNLRTKFLVGDFDAQVEFELLDWPLGNGARLGIGLGLPFGGMQRTSFGLGPEVYLTHFFDGVTQTGTSDLEGALRMVRTGGILTGFYRDASNAWVPLHSGPSFADATSFSISLWTAPSEWQGHDVRVALDNVEISYSLAAVPDGGATSILLAGGVVALSFFRRLKV
jgi:hypothetical protein